MILENEELSSFMSSRKYGLLYEELLNSQSSLARGQTLSELKIKELNQASNLFMSTYFIFENYLNSKNIKINNLIARNSFISSMAGEATTQYLKNNSEGQNLNLDTDLNLSFDDKYSFFKSVLKESVSYIKMLDSNFFNDNSLNSYFDSVKLISQNKFNEFDSDSTNLNFNISNYHFEFQVRGGKIISPVKENKVRVGSSSSNDISPLKISKPKISFVDVIGLEEQKKDIKEYLSPILGNSDNWKKLTKRKNVDINYNLLFYGPPGTGKTYFAEALAGELGIPFYEFNGSDFVEGLHGKGKNILVNAYESAAKNPYAIIFIDEADVIAASRGSRESDLKTDVTNMWLSYLWGLKAKSNVITIASTNRIDIFDSALISRFDYGDIPFDIPPKNVQIDVLKYHLGKYDNSNISDELLLSYINKMQGNQMRKISSFAMAAAKNAQYRNKTLVEPENLENAYLKQKKRAYQREKLMGQK